MLVRPHASLVQDVAPARSSHSGILGVSKATPAGSFQAAERLFPRDPALCDPQLDAKVSLGTTIIALSFDGGVVLAADSRTSTGSYVVNRTSNKLTKLTNNIYCCRSGSAADTQAIAESVSSQLGAHEREIGRPPNVATAARMIQKQCYERKWEIQAGIIVAGFDALNGGSVYSIPLGGACVKLDYAMGGSGSTYIWGWMDQNYKPGMTRDQCLNLVKHAVAHALSRDGSSGGVIRTMTIDASGSEHSTTPWTHIPYCMEKDAQFAKIAVTSMAPSSTDVIGVNEMDSSKRAVEGTAAAASGDVVAKAD